MKYYAVRIGRNPGIYHTWDECKRETMGFKGASFKKFSTREDAEAFINEIEEDKKESAEKDELVVYVDGSYRNSDKSHSYGVYMFNDEEEYTYSKRFFKDSDMRNVSGEIKGAMRAMEEAAKLGKKKIYLHYDYEGIRSWALAFWKTNKEGTIYYKNFYDSIKDKLEVKFIKVEAHTGVKYNELVDKLAKEAK
ncbi:MAG: ribonuclease H family protein [Peptoniphilus harei]|uniref:ribonuclease H n=2 Tax=Peptoniphilus harei TaxID=54005 RepID=E4KZX2_9FIRM|nr:ribonuclease H family protein [Peptoniphilus harei]EFR32548.1 ribonuclease HI [Peptoniphilus harei ACS-146-V-Sch2b]KXA31741.1 ribonuclease HI [Peptoniphilus harei]MDK7377067.1 ribonuclease H family protein [Peptoniphilus harei]MDK7679382.1 ribonuclease H family protein [Peptoniphilus harei]MDK7754424.1 ribonuclease H family protein [Peptoniphilus harei]